MTYQTQQPPGQVSGASEALQASISSGQRGIYNLDNVSLLTQTDTGIVELPGLALEFGAQGFSVKRTSGAVVKTIPWDVITSIEVEDEQKVLPSDPDCSLIYVKTADRVHRFKKRNQEAKSVAESIGEVASLYTTTKGATVSGNLNLEKILPWIACGLMILITIALVVLHLSNAIKIS
jgi:hypothetical protein